MSNPDSCPPLPPVIIFGGYFVTLTAGVDFATRSIPVYVLNERWEEARFSRYVRAIRLPANGRYPQSAMDFLTASASNHLKGSVLLAGGDEELEIIAKNREALAGRLRTDLSNPADNLTVLAKMGTNIPEKEDAWQCNPVVPVYTAH